MSLIEFIGFLISFGALIFLFLKRAWEERRRRQNPEAYQKELEEKEEKLQKFLKSLKTDMEEMKEQEKDYEEEEEEEILPQLPIIKKIEAPSKKKQVSSYRTVQDDYLLKTKMDGFKQRSAVEERHMEPAIEESRFQEFGSEVVSAELGGKSMQNAYKITEENKIPRISSVTSRLFSKRDLLIYNEIFGKPKGLRTGPPWYDYFRS